jgi:hypothetical protein
MPRLRFCSGKRAGTQFPEFKMTEVVMMKIQLVRPDVYTEVWFETLFKAMDRLHDEASDGTVVSIVDPANMVGWLEDIIYTAQETISEIKAREPGDRVTDAELQR